VNRYTVRTFVLELLLILGAALFISPLLVAVNIALRPDGQAGSPLTLTTAPSFENVVTAFVQGHLAAALLNSAIVTAVSTVIAIAFSAFAGYYLARRFGRLPRGLFLLFLAGLLLPIQLATLPLYTTLQSLGLIGNLGGLILHYAGSTMPFSVFLYTSFLRSIPTDYEEAARIDGCGPVTTFVQVVFPLLRPVTGTVLILNALNIYNDFFTPLLYLTGSGQETAPVALQSFVGEYVANWPVIFAGVLVTVVPILILYFILQRHIIKGFAGGLKG
jgi:raffinose/stachyose/melibiose transport system permease protein